MSRIPPASVRVTSGTLHFSEIGTSLYYFSAQLKSNLALNKAVSKLSKNLGFPGILKRRTVLPLLVLGTLPAYTQLRAKRSYVQLFNQSRHWFTSKLFRGGQCHGLTNPRIFQTKPFSNEQSVKHLGNTYTSAKALQNLCKSFSEERPAAKSQNRLVKKALSQKQEHMLRFHRPTALDSFASATVASFASFAFAKAKVAKAKVAKAKEAREEKQDNQNPSVNNLGFFTNTFGMTRRGKKRVNSRMSKANLKAAALTNFRLSSHKNQVKGCGGDNTGLVTTKSLQTTVFERGVRIESNRGLIRPKRPDHTPAWAKSSLFTLFCSQLICGKHVSPKSNNLIAYKNNESKGFSSRGKLQKKKRFKKIDHDFEYVGQLAKEDSLLIKHFTHYPKSSIDQLRIDLPPTAPLTSGATTKKGTRRRHLRNKKPSSTAGGRADELARHIQYNVNPKHSICRRFNTPIQLNLFSFLEGRLSAGAKSKALKDSFHGFDKQGQRPTTRTIGTNRLKTGLIFELGLTTNYSSPNQPVPKSLRPTISIRL